MRVFEYDLQDKVTPGPWPRLSRRLMVSKSIAIPRRIFVFLGRTVIERIFVLSVIGNVQLARPILVGKLLDHFDAQVGEPHVLELAYKLKLWPESA